MDYEYLYINFDANVTIKLIYNMTILFNYLLVVDREQPTYVLLDLLLLFRDKSGQAMWTKTCKKNTHLYTHYTHCAIMFFSKKHTQL